MDHPETWWEVSTNKDSVFRISKNVADSLILLMKNLMPESNCITEFNDLYQSPVVIRVSTIDAIWECSKEMRDACRARYDLIYAEDKEWKNAHKDWNNE